jgi:hypothetical protein
MPVIVVTRLRLRDPALLTEFFTAGAAVLQVLAPTGGSGTVRNGLGERVGLAGSGMRARLTVIRSPGWAYRRVTAASA